MSLAAGAAASLPALVLGLKNAKIACGAVENPALDALSAAEAAAISAFILGVLAQGVVAGTATGALGGGPGVPVVGAIT